MKMIAPKRALISVSDKNGLIDFANSLVELGIEIISTGGTSLALQHANIPHQKIEDITEFPEIFDGRVKSLHPKIGGGILGKRDKHQPEAAQHKIDWIDLVVVNFYPFFKVIQKKELTLDEIIENIDIGGPTLVRAAAKNFAWVGTIVDSSDYVHVIQELKLNQGLSLISRKKWAQKAFALTSSYDSLIHQYFLDKTNETFLPSINLELEKSIDLRYGENPHQQAAAYQLRQDKSGILSAIKHQGKALSYNNILDADAAWNCVSEFERPACAIIKHANPCGVATSHTLHEAYVKAYHADSLSAFGGIVALNRPCTKEIAESLVAHFLEVVIAPAYHPNALPILMTKQNLRVLEMNKDSSERLEMKFIRGGVLMQEKDSQVVDLQDLKIVTHLKPTDEEMDSMLFAWRVLKHIKSNGILLAKVNCTVGIGAGQVSRVDAVDLALHKAGEKTKGAILASDAFFPFRDSIDRLANTGIRAVIQPGGSIRDEEVIAACNDHGIAMVFTGKRCFKH